MSMPGIERCMKLHAAESFHVPERARIFSA